MQFASKCSVLQILWNKIEVYFCDPFPLRFKSSFIITSTINLEQLTSSKIKIFKQLKTFLPLEQDIN